MNYFKFNFSVEWVKMRELFEKMIDESMAAQRADIDTIKKKRGTDFKIKDAEPYVKVASNGGYG